MPHGETLKTLMPPTHEGVVPHRCQPLDVISFAPILDLITSRRLDGRVVTKEGQYYVTLTQAVWPRKTAPIDGWQALVILGSETL